MRLKYYAKIEYATIYDRLIQASINTENQLMVFYASSCQNFTYYDIITGAYIVFDQGGPIDHCTDVPVTVSQYSDESDYNI